MAAKTNDEMLTAQVVYKAARIQRTILNGGYFYDVPRYGIHRRVERLAVQVGLEMGWISYVTSTRRLRRYNVGQILVTDEELLDLQRLAEASRGKKGPFIEAFSHPSTDPRWRDLWPSLVDIVQKDKGR